MSDLEKRMKGKVRLSTDGYRVYTDAISEGVLSRKDLEYARIVKVFAGVRDEPGNPTAYKDSVMELVYGDPNEVDFDGFGTTFIERHNLTLRMGLRRFMRMTNGHSKKRLHHNYQLALFMMYYNFIRPHMTLTERAGGTPTTPAMAAGIADRPYSFREFLRTSDELTKPGPRKPYGPRRTITRRKAKPKTEGLIRPAPSKVPVSTRDARVARVVRHDFAT